MKLYFLQWQPYVFTITHKCPKKYRFSIVSQMQNYILDAVENLYRANAVQLAQQTIINREHYRREAMAAFRLLGIVVQSGSKAQSLPINWSRVPCKAEA